MTLAALRDSDPDARTPILAAWMRDAHAMDTLARDPSREAVLLEVGALLTQGAAVALRRRLKACTLREVQPGSAPDSRRLEDCAAGAPDLPTPAGYALSPDGVWRLSDDGAALIARRPIAVQGRYRDLDTGAAHVEVGWSEDGRWTSVRAPRESIADGRALVRLAGQGAPVVSGLAGPLAIYLAEQEHASGLQLQAATARCGWHDTAYQAGASTIGGEPIALLSEPSVSQLAEAIAPGGTWAGWQAAVAQAAEIPHAWLAIYAAAASAVMRPCGVDVGAVVSVVGRRGRGKTTVLRLAASVWGRPAEVGGLIRSWDSTALHIEQSAALMSECCLLLDETSRVSTRDRDRVPQTVYALANGGGRGRGTDTHHRSWRLVALSTGEAPLRSYGGQEGASSRTIEVTGDPMPDAATAQALEWEIDTHHGHLGPRLVKVLQRKPWRALQAWYRDRVREHQAAHPGHDRAAKAVALLEAAAHSVHATGLPRPTVDVWAWLWSHIDEHGVDSDQPSQAWEIYLARRSSEVEGGRWPADLPTPADTVAQWLTQAGYVSSAMMAEWRARRWIETAKDGRLPRRGRVRTYVVVPVLGSPGWVD